MRKLHLLLSLPASASYGSELSLHLRHDRCSQGILFALRWSSRSIGHSCLLPSAEAGTSCSSSCSQSSMQLSFRM